MLSLISVHMDLYCAYTSKQRSNEASISEIIYDNLWRSSRSVLGRCVELDGSKLKIVKSNAPHLLRKANRCKIAPHTFWILPFRLSCRPLPCSSHSQSCLCLVSFLPSSLMPKKPVGPWVLNEVKTRLRREQVVRKAAATARYRQLEERDRDQSSSTREDEDGRNSVCHCVLVIAVLPCLLLSLSVLLLSGVVLSLAKK
jgi:hypothetical protein